MSTITLPMPTTLSVRPDETDAPSYTALFRQLQEARKDIAILQAQMQEMRASVPGSLASDSPTTTECRKLASLAIAAVKDADTEGFAYVLSMVHNRAVACSEVRSVYVGDERYAKKRRP